VQQNRNADALADSMGICRRTQIEYFAGQDAVMLTDRDSLLRKLHELRSEHRDLDTVITRVTEQGPVDQLHLVRLKKRKLLLKDEIAWLESRLIPDNIA
jgi:hypothetical protein